MKPMKLTSFMVMLLVGFSAAAQEEFFDDVYFSSSKKDKKEKTEEKVIQPKEDAERTTMTSTYSTSKRKSAVSDEERDVDEYNRSIATVISPGSATYRPGEPFRPASSLRYNTSPPHLQSVRWGFYIL